MWNDYKEDQSIYFLECSNEGQLILLFGNGNKYMSFTAMLYMHMCGKDSTILLNYIGNLTNRLRMDYELDQYNMSKSRLFHVLSKV